MYIASIRMQNYRCFQDTIIEFQPHSNLIIGENNAGKSTVLRALGLVFSRQARPQLDVHDFYQGISPSKEHPLIRITATLRPEGEGKDSLDDKALVAAWLTKLEQDWEAQLVYEFGLSEEDSAAFSQAVGKSPEGRAFWKAVREFLPRYRSRVYGGLLTARIKADPDALDRFDFRSLDAIRDAASNLSSGSNALLRSMLRQVIDLDIAPDDPTGEEKRRKDSFRQSAGKLTEDLITRIQIAKLTSLVTDTGAADGGKPVLFGEPDETDFIAALRLFVQKHDFKLPVDRNGLGYNNLIYISLVLASLDVEADPNAVGRDNAKLFPMLAIEEPEAHLHPALQYKLLKCVRDLLRKKRSRQVFITTHSTHITAASSLDEIICLCAPEEGQDPAVTYPGRLFPATKEGLASKKYVERYLDATKSNLLFAKGVIFVEGISEQLLIPRFAECVGLPLEDHHVAVIAVGGSTFKHFLHLFGAGCPPEAKSCALSRPVACIVDCDPTRKEKNQNGARWKSCWPYEINADQAKYDYRERSAVISKLQEQIANGSPHICVRFGRKTLEYDIAFYNYGSSLLPGCTKDVELKGDAVDALSRFTKDRKKSEFAGRHRLKERAEFASLYLQAVSELKGGHAFDLDRCLRENSERTDQASQDANSVSDQPLLFGVPKHIKEAIRWACRVDAKALK